MTKLIGSVLICVLFSFFAFASPDIKNYPNRLITNDFGIITTDDLAHDATMRNPTPYDPSHFLMARYWQCLPTKIVKPQYRTWRDADSMGPSNVIVTLCDLEIHVLSKNDPQIYSDRRGHPVKYCRDFMRDWRRVTRSEKIVCLNGDDGSYSNDRVLGRFKSWAWNKVKTKKGCFSYFGECRVAGCANNNCPK